MLLLRKYIKVFILLVLPVYLVLLVNSMSNMHVHVLSNGMVVKHAHPFDRGAESNSHHHHSNSDTSFYQGFCQGYFDTAEPLLGLAGIIPSFQFIASPMTVIYQSEQTDCDRLRGPPIS